MQRKATTINTSDTEYDGDDIQDDLEKYELRSDSVLEILSQDSYSV